MKTTCLICKREIAVTKTGKIATHGHERAGAGNSRQCPGAGHDASATSLELAAYMEKKADKYSGRSRLAADEKRFRALAAQLRSKS